MTRSIFQANFFVVSGPSSQIWLEFPRDECLNFSDGWLTSFKECCGLRELKHHGEAASADPETVEKERERLRELIRKHGLRLKDIWNMDESALFWAYVYYFSLLL